MDFQSYLAFMGISIECAGSSLNFYPWGIQLGNSNHIILKKKKSYFCHVYYIIWFISTLQFPSQAIILWKASHNFWFNIRHILLPHDFMLSMTILSWVSLANNISFSSCDVYNDICYVMFTLYILSVHDTPTLSSCMCHRAPSLIVKSTYSNLCRTVARLRPGKVWRKSLQCEKAAGQLWMGGVTPLHHTRGMLATRTTV